jgi:arylsulfatase A-like enzyme
MHSLNSFLRSCFTIASWLACSIGHAADDRPNILFMMADDHTSQAWGCYGSRFSPHFTTPNIDRIAKEGARLTHCFVTNSICVPSRACILTGQYSHVSGVKTLADSLDPKKQHVGHLLQAAGYQTSLIGKWHLKSVPSGFDYWNIIKGQGRYHEPVMYEMDMENPKVQKGAYSTDVFTSKALNWLDRREKNRPFCLMLHFKATHEPWQFHARHADLFENVSFPEPEDMLGETGPVHSRIPGWPLEILTKRMTSHPNHGNGYLKLTSQDPVVIRRQTYQKFIKDYLRCAVAIDENIGRVLDYLDRNELTRKTVIIYTSDQGYFLGEHNYFDKRFMLEESLRMPLVIKYPEEIIEGTVNKDMILNVDFAATILDYAGQKTPSTMQGKSFRENLRGNTPANWRESMYYRYWENSEERPAHYGIRTYADKLIYYDGLKSEVQKSRWEYYDLNIDPGESLNAYDTALDQKREETLKKLLSGWRKTLGDD